MLVSVDTVNGIVTVYAKSVISVPISQAHKLRSLLSGKTVQYESETLETSGDEVLEMIGDLLNDPTVARGPKKSSTFDSDGRQWLHAKGSGFMNIPAAKMKFDGPADFKLLEKLGYNVFETHPILQELMDKGMLAVVSTSQMNRLKQMSAEKRAKFEEKMMLNSDGSDIIVDTHASTVDPRTGRVKRQMGTEFEEVRADDPEDNFKTEEEKIVDQYGFGRQPEPGEEDDQGFDPNTEGVFNF
jgi:hypothetical protein